MKLPRLTLPVFVSQAAGRAIALLRALPRRALITLGVTVGLVLLFLGISLLPSAPPEPPKAATVLRLNLAKGEKKQPDGLLDPGTGENGSSAGTAALLIGANGAVISDPALIEMSSDGPLPRIGEDGRTPMDTYSRKTDTKEIRPRIAIVVTGLGLSQQTSMAAIDKLPPGATLGFSPYGSDLQGLVSSARGNGHEVVLELPLEPYDFPNNDPGQNTLIAGGSPKSNGLRLRWVMSRFTSYAGLISMEGGKFLSNATDTRMLLDAARKRGLYFVDSGTSDQSVARDAATVTGARFARADVRVDANPSPDTVTEALSALEKIAMQRGSAIGVASSYPGTISKVSIWANELEQKGFALVPLSALLSPGAAKQAALPETPATPEPKPAPKPPALRRSGEADMEPAGERRRPGATSADKQGTRNPAAGPEPLAGPHP